MKKTVTWVYVIAFIILLVDWGVIGIKLLDGDYNFVVGAYLALACLAVMLACAYYKLLCNKCPHCGKQIQLDGKYCPYCGKEI